MSVVRLVPCLLALAVLCGAQTYTTIPRDYTFLSRAGWTATASSCFSGCGAGNTFDASHVLDGDWGSEWDAASGSASITINMGAARSGALTLVWYPRNGGNSIPAAWTISTSPDNVTYTQVSSGSWGGSSLTPATNYVSAFTAASGTQYIKFNATSSNGGEIGASEIQVATGTMWTVGADSTLNSGQYIPMHALDGYVDSGDTYGFWNSNVGPPNYLIVNFGVSHTFNAIQWTPRQSAFSNEQPSSIQVYVSNDCSTWGSAVATITSGIGTGTSTQTIPLGSRQTASCMKVVSNATSRGSGSTALSEINIASSTLSAVVQMILQ